MTEEKLFSAIAELNVNKDSTTWNERTFQQAPHKPFLLLSILDGISIGWIKSPQIVLSQDLIETFFRYWNNIMGDDRTTTIALPFYHMSSEPFWELQYYEGARTYKSSPSLGGLTERVAYARINTIFFEMMRNEEKRNEIISSLLESYFSEELHEDVLAIHLININAYQYAEELEQIAAEPFELYHDKKEGNYSWQKSQQRKYGFGLNIRKAYNNRCAVCRSKVTTPNGASLVEGAHILSWSSSRNDDPRNGLALCKTHHWMYDSFLLGIQPDYRIHISNWLKNNGEYIDHTLKWDTKDILAPETEKFLPNREALEIRYRQYKEN